MTTTELESTARLARLTTDSAAVLYLVTLTALSSRVAMLSKLRLVAMYLAVPLSHLDPRRWDVVQIEALRTALAAKYSPANVNMCLTAVRGLLRAALRLGHIDHMRYEQLAAVRKVPGGNSEPAGRHVTTDELARLFAWYREQREPWARRDECALALLYGCGLRRTEACGLLLSDRRDAKLVVRGKGRKKRIAPMPTGTIEALDAWLAVRGDAPGHILAPIVRGIIKARELTSGALYESLKRSAREAGVAHFSPHDLRRTVIGDLFDRGADVSTVQHMMGHASPSTTTRYDRRPVRAREAAAASIEVPFRVAS